MVIDMTPHKLALLIDDVRHLFRRTGAFISEYRQRASSDAWARFPTCDTRPPQHLGCVIEQPVELFRKRTDLFRERKPVSLSARPSRISASDWRMRCNGNNPNRTDLE